MEEREGVIRAACPLYACRVCRTKTGWPHQCWCKSAALTAPGCDACCYFKQNRCAHPARRKGGEVASEA